MSQELQFPVSEIAWVEFRSHTSIWAVAFKDSDTTLDCSLIAANSEMCYVSCENVLDGDLPDYVKPMEHDE